jgi:hypothetical protein
MKKFKILIISISFLFITVILTKNCFKEETLTELQLENIEALSAGESTNFSCGYSAYEWGSAWYEPTRYFTVCRSGCPEKSGTSPKYINC